MEQARLIMAIGLSFLVFFIWDAFFVEKKPVEQAPQQQAETQPAEPTELDRAVPAGTPSRPGPVVAAGVTTTPEEGARDPRTILVSTDKFEARLNERGAAITSFKLKDHMDSVGENGAMLELVPGIVPGGTALINFKDSRLGGLQKALFSAGSSPDKVAVFNEEKSVAFSWVGEHGTEVIKTYTFNPGKYLIDLEVAIIIRSSGP